LASWQHRPNGVPNGAGQICASIADQPRWLGVDEGFLVRYIYADTYNI
jgi:hypothetical protein